MAGMCLLDANNGTLLQLLKNTPVLTKALNTAKEWKVHMVSHASNDVVVL